MRFALAAALFCPVAAQVTINGTGSGLTDSAGGSSSFTYDLVSPGNSETLVVGFYNDNTLIPSTVTFDGNPPDGFSEDGRTVVAYYFNPDESVDIEIAVNTDATNSGFFVYELEGIDVAGTVDLGTGAEITTTGDGKFVVSYTGINFGTGAETVPSAGSVITEPGVLDINGGIGGGALAHGYGYSGSAGAQPVGWDYANGQASGQASVAFKTTLNPDSDADGLIDAWELANFGDLTSARGTQEQDPALGTEWDNDGDGFDNEAEETATSNPNNSLSIPGDVDGDAFADADEILYFGNLAQGPDDDFDGDYSSNIDEINAAASPSDANDWPDVDDDLMADGWEASNGLVVGTDDSLGDADGDGYPNIDEFDAGSDPQDILWTPDHAVLAHRWSFSGDLSDSVGGSDAQIVNDDAESVGLSSVIGDSSVELFGGEKATSDYVMLGSNLLSGLQAGGVQPLTIEVWATQVFVQNWSRIFNFGVNDGANPGANESLRMTWSQGTDLFTDQVSWEPTTNQGPGNSPYVEEVPYHIVMTVVPAVFSGGAVTSGAQLVWYSAPVSDSQEGGHPLYGGKGTLDSPSDLRDLLDSAGTLGRSYYGDGTASAVYDEFRIWKGALTEVERELFQLLGPDNIDRSDADEDGFPDQWEIARFGDTDTAMALVDTDGDGDDDDLEFENETDPDDMLSTLFDSDRDDLDDDWEMQYFNNLLQFGDDDFDFDYSDNEIEEAFGTDPTDPDDSPDTDGDGIADGWEQLWFFDLTTADSTLREGGVDTNPDGDYDTDLEEYQGGFDPEDEFSGRDSDGDGLVDYWEFVFLGDFETYDGDDDPDGDTVSNTEEFAAFTDPSDPDDFPDSNGDGIPDGRTLVATDGFQATSFNAGLNWDDGAAPVAGSNYLVFGQTLRTPDVDASETVFAGDLLVISTGSLWFKGTDSIVSANYVLDQAVVRNAVSVPGPVTLGGTLDVSFDSQLFADNGALIITADVSGEGVLTLDGNAAAVNPIQFESVSNTFSGDVTMNPTASLIVNGVLATGSGSIYQMAPAGPGAGNQIGGTGTIDLAGTMNIDLSGAAPADGATWDLLTPAIVNFDPGFTVTGSGFTSDGAAVGSRIWTSGDGDYVFDESTGVMTFVGEVVGFAAWAGGTGLTPGVDDGTEDNPDGDSQANVLEYQLGGDPLEFEGSLVAVIEDETSLTFGFDRFGLSEADSTLNFRWSTDLVTWNVVPIEAASSGPDVNGVVVTVTEEGGATAEYDRVEVLLPKTNAVDGRIFGQLQGTSP